MSLSLLSWNVNSLRVRLPLVLRVLDEHEPDIVCLQETRIADAAFPRAAFEERGYVVASACSSGYAGVAIASREPIEDTIVGIAGFVEAKAPGRRLACRIGGRWIDTVYVPTRTAIGKVAFLDALRDDYATRLRDASLVLAGDFNICLDARDYASPSMISSPDVHPGRPEDLAFRGVLAHGLHDCFRERHDEGGHFSWFPLTPWAMKRNYGMRLDYVFASRDLASSVVDVVHDREPRSWPRPSDHLPLRAEFDVA